MDNHAPCFDEFKTAILIKMKAITPFITSTKYKQQKYQ